MSHHFDTATAREDPRINICDFYLFRGRPGSMVMAMTVNPDAGLSAPDTFREDALYAFRIDLNDDAREEVTFRSGSAPSVTSAAKPTSMCRISKCAEPPAYLRFLVWKEK